MNTQQSDINTHLVVRAPSGDTICQLFIMVVCSLMLLSGSVFAAPVDQLQSDFFQVKKLNVGFDGYYKIGLWTEAQFDFQMMFSEEMAHDDNLSQLNSKLSLSVGVQDPSGRFVFTPVSAFSLKKEVLPSTAMTEKAEANKQVLYTAKNVRVMLKFGRPDSNILFRWKFGDHPTQTETIHIENSTAKTETSRLIKFRRGLFNSVNLWGVIGNPDGFSRLEKEDSFHVVYFQNEAELPRESLAYESLDALLIVGDYQMDQNVDSALEEWVRMGGKIFVSVGQDVAAYQKSLLSEWNPVPVLGEQLFINLKKVVSYSEKELDIRFKSPVQGAKFKEVEGNLLIEDEKVPLLIRTSYGFGTVTCFAIDVAKPPLSKWRMLPDLLHKMVDGKKYAIQDEEQNKIGTLSHTGITDLKTELSASVEYFPEVSRVSSWFVLGAMLLFLVAVGPLDYYLVCHVLKKPHLTWVTLPLLIACTTAVGMSLSRNLNGDQLRMNQMEFVDIDIASHSMRMQNWSAIYSSENQRFQLQASLKQSSWITPFLPHESRASLLPCHLSWSGVPEDIYSGMYRTGGNDYERPDYHLSKQVGGIDNFPIPIWSAQNLTAVYHTQLITPHDKDYSTPVLESHLKGTLAGQLEGHLISHLSVPIENWILIYRSQIYHAVSGKGFDTIKPGVPFSLVNTHFGIRQNEAKSYLTGEFYWSQKRGVETTERVFAEQTEYDPLNRNIRDMATMITFHTIAGGTSYTNLENNILKKSDLSTQVRAGRAVLLGQIKQPASQIQIHSAHEIGQPVLQSNTFVRIVIPVTKSSSKVFLVPKKNETEEPPPRKPLPPSKNKQQE